MALELSAKNLFIFGKTALDDSRKNYTLTSLV